MFGSPNLPRIQNARNKNYLQAVTSRDALKASKLLVCRSYVFIEVPRLRAIRLTFRTWLHLRRKDNL